MQAEECKIVEIVRRSQVVLGRYMDHDIHEYVYLDDGRAFVYESVAVLKEGFTFHTDYPDERYILVNGNLLYREVTS